MRRYLLLAAWMPSIAQAQTFTGGGGAITDDGVAHTHTITVTGLPNGIDTLSFGLVSVCINVQHPAAADLDIELMAPDGRRALLATWSGWSGHIDAVSDFTNTCFTNDATAHLVDGSAPFAGEWRPLQRIDVNDGQDPNGDWRLVIRDAIPDHDGTLIDWSLTFGNTPMRYTAFTGSDLPIVVVATDQEVVDEPKVPATVGIINNPPGVRNELDDPFTDLQGRGGIELRGASSLSFAKKSYGLEFRGADDQDTSVAVLGMPAESDWVLTSDHADKSLLNNALAYHLGRALGHWAPRTRHVELVLNDQYLGNYLFTEKIKRDGDRVDITKLLPTDVSGDELTGGYIIKIDRAQGQNTGGWNSPFPPPAAMDDEVITFLYDEPAEPAPEQAAYIQHYVDSFETALHGPLFTDPQQGYARFIDRRSFIDFMIIQELARNVDAYRSSAFLYKDKDSNGGRLTMGPLWDFDLAFGSTSICAADGVEGWAFATWCDGDKLVPFWWSRFLEDPGFVDSLRCRWNVLREGPLHPDTLAAWCDTMATRLAESQQRNFDVWPVLGYQVVPATPPLPVDHPGEVQRLKDWLLQRAAWLDAVLPPGTCAPDGVQEPQVGRPTVYPVPLTDDLYIAGIRTNDACAIALRAVCGRTVLERKVVPHAGMLTVRGLARLPAGSYILTIQSDGQVRTVHVLKQ